MYSRKWGGGEMRTGRTPSKATITNKTRPAGSFSSSYSQPGRLAGPVLYVQYMSFHCIHPQQRYLSFFFTRPRIATKHVYGAILPVEVATESRGVESSQDSRSRNTYFSFIFFVVICNCSYSALYYILLQFFVVIT